MYASGRPAARRFIDPWKCARPDAHSPSFVICIDCPKPWARVPYVAFFMPHHVRGHLRNRKDHRLAFWCEPHSQVEDGLIEKPGTTEILGRYPLPCDHCEGRLSFMRDRKTGPIYLQCDGCLCEWTAHWTLFHQGSVCPVYRVEVA